MKIFRASLLVFLLLITSSCTGAKSGIKGDEAVKARLIKRVSEFQGNLLNREIDKAIAMKLKREDDNNKGIPDRYIDSFKEGKHMASHFQLDYVIDGIEMKRNRAKVKLKYLVTLKEGRKPDEAIVYNFWQYDGGEWFFLFGGKSLFFNEHKW